MFGLQANNPEKKSKQEFFFDLEKELKAPEKQKELILHLENRIKELKEMLRTGEKEEHFHVIGDLFNGYVAVLKVISRVVGYSSKIR